MSLVISAVRRLPEPRSLLRCPLTPQRLRDRLAASLAALGAPWAVIIDPASTLAAPAVGLQGLRIRCDLHPTYDSLWVWYVEGVESGVNPDGEVEAINTVSLGTFTKWADAVDVLCCELPARAEPSLLAALDASLFAPFSG